MPVVDVVLVGQISCQAAIQHKKSAAYLHTSISITVESSRNMFPPKSGVFVVPGRRNLTVCYFWVINIVSKLAKLAKVSLGVLVVIGKIKK